VSPRPSRLLTTAALALAALGTSLSAAALPTTALAAAHAGQAPAGPARTTTIRPAELSRGDDPGVPVQLGRTILDGSTSVTVRGGEVHLLGRSGDGYVVETYPRRGGHRVEHVSPEGTRTTVMSHVVGDVRLSADGEQVFETVVRSGSESVVTVRDAGTGTREARRTFPGVVTVLDAAGGRAVLGAWSPQRTLSWQTRTDRTRRISDRAGYFADVRADRLAVLTGDPYDGGCSVLAALSSPRQPLWRSCREAVTAASPDGRRLLTRDLLGDGPLARVSVHGDHGHLFDTYRATGGLGAGVWETDRSLLLEAYGQRRGAIVRCEPTGCERASKLVDTPR
jgi:hypothetical protein